MITELNNLKVRALAVSVPDGAFDFSYSLAYNSVWYLTHEIGKGVKSVGENWFQTELIPEGNWTILGRANDDELDYEQLLDPNSPILPGFEWAAYCQKNDLTNELILIESNH